MPLPVGTTRTNIVGFESGDFSECYVAHQTSSTNPEISDTDSHTGTYALRVYGTGGGVGISGYNSSGESEALLSDLIYTRFYFKVNDLPETSATIFVVIDNNDTIKMSLRLDADGGLTLKGKSTTFAVDGERIGDVGTLETHEWYRIEVKCGRGRRARYQVLLNGSRTIMGRANLGASKIQYVGFGNMNDEEPDEALDMWFDDISLDETGYPGAGRIAMLNVIDDGTNLDWAGSWADVVDPNNHDTAVLAGGDEVSTFTLASTEDADISGDITNVKVIAKCGAQDGETAAVKTSLKLDDELFYGGQADELPEGFVTVSSLFDVNPNTDGNWTTDHLDSMEAGIRSSLDSTGAKCNFVAVMVEYNPSASLRRIFL